MSDDKSREVQDSHHGRPDGETQRGAQRAPALGGAVTIWAAAVALIVALVWWTVTEKLAPGPLVNLIVGGGLAVFWTVVNFAQIRQALSRRRGRKIANSSAFAVLVLGIAVLINYLGGRHHIRKDLTESKRYSLSEQTHKIAQSLDQDVEILAFVSQNYHDYAATVDRLREYELLSPRIKLRIYDPQTSFDKVEEYEVRMDGTVIIESGDKTEDVVGASEEQITSAVLAVTTGEKTKVYFLTGHGEQPLEGSGPDGLGTVKRSLENQQYEVEALALMTMAEPQVPTDCAVLVIAGPQQALPEKEIQAIKDYASQDGKLFVAVDPPPAPDLHEILAEQGITPLAGVVIDPERSYWGQAQVPMVLEPAAHDITRDLEAIALPNTRAFEVEMSPPPQYPGAPPQQPRARALLESSGSAWLETNPRGNVQKDPEEKGGPLTMAAVIDESPPAPPQMPGMPPPPPPEGGGTRMVVVGSSAVMTDRTVQAGLVGGAHMVLKSIAWMVEDEKLVSIPPKDYTASPISLTETQRKLAMVSVLGLVPLLIIVGGGIMWWVRRRA